MAFHQWHPHYLCDITVARALCERHQSCVCQINICRHRHFGIAARQRQRTDERAHDMIVPQHFAAILACAHLA